VYPITAGMQPSVSIAIINNVKTDRTTARCIEAMMTYRTIPAMLLVPQRTSQILATHPPGQNQHQSLHLTYVLLVVVFVSLSLLIGLSLGHGMVPCLL